MEAEDNRQLQSARTKKALASSLYALNFSKSYFHEAKERAKQGEPYILTNVGVPVEIMHAMDLLAYPQNLNFSALIAAKQMAPRYLNVLNERGYFRDLCRYCSLPLGCYWDPNQDDAPWGGMPKPTALVVEQGDDPIIRIWELMAKQFDVPLYIYYHTMIADPPPKGLWQKAFLEKNDIIEKYSYQEEWRLDYAIKETENLISFLETVTGRSLCSKKLKEVMDRSTEQFDYIAKAMELAAPAPAIMGMGDHMAHLIGTQFFRGHEFGLEVARMLYEELKERRQEGMAICDDERIRLMYLWVPNWFTPAFYDYFADKYGAVFCWLGYLPIITHGLVRRNTSDPLKALASRYVHYGELGNTPWWTESHLAEAKKWKIDGAVYPIAESCKFLCGPMLLTKRALEESGVPTLNIVSDMVDPRDWDEAKMIAIYSNFIETLIQRKTA
ncbi:MAG: R-phenyllactate dehydratase subunit alpha precursor [Syntrophorhabdus sp. PtaU1.Bin058]|nr:MAG: R-phenyllactate dehydratase subunit alpha precursor [Syntrophorhabdus sp. PtaU1.Bin058]